MPFSIGQRSQQIFPLIRLLFYIMQMPRFIKKFIIITQSYMNQDQSDFFSEPAQWPQVIFHRTSTAEIREPTQPIPIQPIEAVAPEGAPQSDHDEPSSPSEVNIVDMFCKNVESFAYSRAHHYYFDLSSFQRDPKSVSYAHDPSNSFKSTFSKDQMMVGGSKLKDIINREYIALPIRIKENRPSRAKNPSHTALFQTEDKKITMDRLIVTYRQILNNIEQLTLMGKISSFICLHRDPRLRQVLSPCLTVSQKRQTLINRLQELLQTKKISERQWFAQDNINAAPSRNQNNYVSIRTKLQVFDKSRDVTSLYSNYYNMKEIIKSPFDDLLIEFMEKVFTFYREQSMSLQQSTIEDLVSNYKQNLVQAYNQRPRIIFPTHILSFADPKIFKATNQIIGKRLSSESQHQYNLLNELCQRLFKTALMAQEQYQVDDVYIFKLEASSNLSKIRTFKQSQSRQSPATNGNQQMLDDVIDYQGLCSECDQQQVFILKRNKTVELTPSQYLVLMNWHWMYLLVQQMYPYINKNPQFKDILASPHYPFINQSVGQAFDSPLVGTFKYCFEELIDSLAGGKHLDFDSFRLQFEFKEDKNLALIWRIQNNQEVQQVKERQEQEVDYDILYFGKRVKSLQNEWV